MSYWVFVRDAEFTLTSRDQQIEIHVDTHSHNFRARVTRDDITLAEGIVIYHVDVPGPGHHVYKIYHEVKLDFTFSHPGDHR